MTAATPAAAAWRLTRTIDGADVHLVPTPDRFVSSDQLEQLALEIERVLYVGGLASVGAWCGAAVACTFDPPAVEIDATLDEPCNHGLADAWGMFAVALIARDLGMTIL